jgi:hypothetical protein
MPRQFTTYQFDLFSSTHSGKTPAIPQWQTLLEGTQQALTALIVRLLADHATCECASQSCGVHPDRSGSRCVSCHVPCKNKPLLSIASRTSSLNPPDYIHCGGKVELSGSAQS